MKNLNRNIKIKKRFKELRNQKNSTEISIDKIIEEFGIRVRPDTIRKIVYNNNIPAV